MKCPQCNFDVNDGYRYCPSCAHDFAPGSDTDLAAVRAQMIERLGARGHGSEPGSLPIVPPPPREPTPRTRGIIYAYTGKQFVMRLIGVIFTLVGGFAFALLGWNALVDVVIDVLGSAHNGAVVSTRYDGSARVNNIPPMVVTFAAGSIHGTSSTFSSRIEAGLTPGAPVVVESVPWWPAAARVRGTSKSALGPFGFMPLIFLVIGLAMWLRAWRSNRNEIIAYKIGVATVARVTRFGEDRSTTVNGRHPTELAWSFDVNGTAYAGSLTHMDGSVLRPLVVAGRVAVVYDPTHPARNTAYVA